MNDGVASFIDPFTCQDVSFVKRDEEGEGDGIGRRSGARSVIQPQEKRREGGV